MTSLEQRWPGFFANPNYIRSGNTITWPNRVRFDVDTTPDLIVTLIEQRQFSIQVLEDGSIFQIYYGFDGMGDILQEASLAFYRGAQPADSQGDPLTEGVVPFSSDENPSAWIRLDYDPSAGRDCLHYHSHLHLSFSSDIRVPVKRVPTPKQFVELIVAWFYPDTYRAFRLPGAAFQLSANDAKNVFEEVIKIQDDIPGLNGIHVCVP
jgi:hypothetical protein